MTVRKGQREKEAVMSKILLIEDIADNATLVQRALTPQGYDIFWAETGEQALELAEKDAPDLILLDLGLPDIDGQTLVGYLRRIPGLEKTPIIVVTAWPVTTGQLMTTAYGCNAMISKPIDVRKFIETVNRYLSPEIKG